MAEIFSRKSLGPLDYNINEWTTLYKVNSTITGALIFDIKFSNMTPISGINKNDIFVEAKVEDVDGNTINYILGPTVIVNTNGFWESKEKIVLLPQDKIVVKASNKGICFYCSLISGLRMN